MQTEISGSTGVNKIQDGTVVNADINSSAAIAGSKLVMPTGSVLQVTQGVLTSVFSFTGSTTWTDTGITANITPSSTSSKILVMVSCALGMSVSAVNVRLRIVRDGSTVVGSSTADAGNSFSHREQNQSGNLYTRFLESYQYLDSPSSTSQETYKVQMYRNTSVNAGTAYINRGDADQSRQYSTITLMEIAGWVQ